MWLASLSVRRRGAIVTTDRWTPTVLASAQESLDFLLDGIGDASRQRSFRMTVTLCRHRALSVEEHDALPVEWHDAPATDIAGGPVEVLWHRGIPERLSTLPCENPTKVPMGSHGAWFPLDCEACPPCVAREEQAEGVCACRRTIT